MLNSDKQIRRTELRTGMPGADGPRIEACMGPIESEERAEPPDLPTR